METENRGKAYEESMRSQYSFLNSSSDNKIDLKISIKNMPINIELKSDTTGRIDYGQSAIRQKEDNSWEFTKKRNKWTRELSDILTEAGVLSYISHHWRDTGYNKTDESKIKEKYKNDKEKLKEELKKVADYTRQNMTPTINLLLDENDDIFTRATGYEYSKLDEEVSIVINQHILKTAINSYYKTRGCHYIQIQNKGLFRISDKDPLSDLTKKAITVPLFEPPSVSLVVRLKGSGGVRGYIYTTALTVPNGFANGIQTANINMTYPTGDRSKNISINMDNIEFKDYLKYLNTSQ